MNLLFLGCAHCGESLTGSYTVPRCKRCGHRIEERAFRAFCRESSVVATCLSCGGPCDADGLRCEDCERDGLLAVLLATSTLGASLA